MQSIQSQIAVNTSKTWILMGIFISLISGLVYLITHYLGLGSNSLVMAFGITTLMSLGSYAFGDKMVLALNGAKEIKTGEYPLYSSIVHDLIRRAGIPMPKLYIINSPALNAFATGKSPSNGMVCVTTGILDTLDQKELAGVLAHELSHIKNYDILLMTVASILVGLLGQLINFLRFSSFFGGKDNRENRSPLVSTLSLIMIIFAPIVATLMQLAISRSREYLADASSAQITRDPAGLISALQKISGSHTHFDQAQVATASLYISNPFGKTDLGSLFSTHPPLAKRIEALQAML